MLRLRDWMVAADVTVTGTISVAEASACRHDLHILDDAPLVAPELAALAGG